MAELFDYQKQLASAAKAIFKVRGLVYIAAEERTGKTFVSLQMLRELGYERIFVVTKKAAIDGWLNVLNTHYPNVSHFVCNYQSLHKVSSEMMKHFDVVIVDEAHSNLGGFPKTSQTAARLQKLAYDKPCVFLSATPCAQTYASLFHQLNICKRSPWDDYRNFYAWFKDYGTPKLIRGAGGRQIVAYDEIRGEMIEPIFKDYFVFLKRADSGEFEVEPVDELCFITPKQSTLDKIDEIRRKKILTNEIENCVIENISKEMHLLHSIESGVAKIDEWRSVEFDEIDEKINYILTRWGDSEDIAIFYEYIAEGERLRKVFSKARILQGTTYAEGVDLSHLKCAVVLSMNFSTAKYIQRRCRLCHPKRTAPIFIYYLLFKGHLSEAVYNCVAQKRQNFTESIYKTFRREEK